MFGISSGNPEEIPLFSLESPEEIPNKCRQFIHYQSDATPLVQGDHMLNHFLMDYIKFAGGLKNTSGVLLAAHEALFTATVPAF